MKLSSWLLTLLMGLLIQSFTYAAEPAGKVGYVRGVVSAKSQTGGSRFLSKGKPIFEADSIVTGGTSFVVLAFKDGTKMTIRPNSVFIISTYRFKNGNNDKASFRLLKGGLRSVTGTINKNKPEKMKITTPVATIGIRGTDFIARLCDGDCATKKGKKNKDTIARLALVKGNVRIKGEKGTRKAKTGTRLKAKETLLTDEKGFAVLVFDDNTRVTVQPSSELKIAEYVFPKGRPQKGKVLLSLAKGGVRTLTGRIGKSNPKDFKLKTPSATMGIRGTGFDTQIQNGGQTFVNVWQGGVIANQGGQTQNIDINQTFQIGNNGFSQLPQMPLNIAAQFKATPRPDKAKTQSIWVSVKSGKVELRKNKPSDSQSSAGNGFASSKNDKKNGSATTKNSGKKKDDSDSKDDSDGKDDSNSKDDSEGKDDSGNKDSGENSDSDGGEETIEVKAGETAMASDADSGKVDDSPSFIANDPYTSVAPGNVEATSDVFGNPSSSGGQSCTVN